MNYRNNFVFYTWLPLWYVCVLYTFCVYHYHYYSEKILLRVLSHVNNHFLHYLALVELSPCILKNRTGLLHISWCPMGNKTEYGAVTYEFYWTIAAECLIYFFSFNFIRWYLWLSNFLDIMHYVNEMSFVRYFSIRSSWIDKTNFKKGNSIIILMHYKLHNSFFNLNICPRRSVKIYRHMVKTFI